MNSKALGQLLIVGLGLIVGIYAAIAILLNPTGGISGISKLITIIGVILGLMSPKGGLFFLVVQAVYADEMKRIGVYYGVQSTQTVSEILVGPLLTLCAINISFLHGLIRRQYKIDLLGWALYLIAPVVAVILLIKGREDGFALSVYLAGTTSLYMTVVPICYGIFKSREEWLKFISWQIIVAAPAAAWGIWQYFNGFNVIEWSYALSGLSRVHTLQMAMREPRIFGLFGSASALGCVGMYGIFSVWRAIRYKKFRFLFILISSLYFMTIVLSHQRTTLLFPLIVIPLAFAFRRVYSTFLVYALAIFIFVLAIFNSSYLLNDGLDEINQVIVGESRWAKNVMSVSTFSDRLRGWERLTRASSWSWFGTQKVLSSDIVTNSNQPDYTSSDFSHDIINRVLINFGAVGLVVILLLASIILITLHRVIFRAKDNQVRNDGAFIIACIIPTLMLSFMGGDNFSATPINLQIWSIFAGIFVIRKVSMITDTKGRASDPAFTSPAVTENRDIFRGRVAHL
jgi:hypothetical protein